MTKINKKSGSFDQVLKYATPALQLLALVGACTAMYGVCSLNGKIAAIGYIGAAYACLGAATCKTHRDLNRLLEQQKQMKQM